MPAHTYPVLIWADAAGASTAVLVGDWETTAACAATEGEALRQLKELLDWRMDHEPWNLEADLAEPALQFPSNLVGVRPLVDVPAVR